ncbi:multiheme c-type cytochrome [Photobacterium alginatilyticum]|uniref:Cytochrome c family protein n=1 Tax=Photobacterium alginatilyticum TaxID=1775171 RepID=A0ABW9YLY7_9GAMM|nr:multiheme c-type cytochrome [Photobacterium alginatilyticum]NBI54705.1 cytochrome c family protein [Photobacterium alginatilyticum]
MGNIQTTISWLNQYYQNKQRNKLVSPHLMTGTIMICCLFILSSFNSHATSDMQKWLKPHKPETQQQIEQQMPFYPSRATTNGKQLTPEMFENPEICKGCHNEIYQQWERSVMANSWEDPIYKALFRRASKATDGQVDNFCIACHSPIGMTSMQATAEMLDSDEHLPGVNCEVCHNIVGISGNDNGAYILSPNKEKHVKLGPRTDATSPYHKTEFSDLHTKSEFCSVCHNVSHPFNSTPIERTYDEWQESAYNEKGIHCQDCHMTPGPGIKDNPGRSAIMGKEREHIYSHEFTGGNSTLHQYFGNPDSAELAREMLRSAATIEFIELPESFTPGQLATIKVKVANVGAGHKLPTGFPEGREVWVDFDVKADNQISIYRSGAIVDGHTEAGTQSFKVILGDANGNVVDLNVWEVDRILSDTRILPNGYSIVDYTFLVPEEVTGDITLNADLKYWPFPQKLVDELLGKGKLKVDIVNMTSTKTTISVEAKDASTAVAMKQ